MSDIYSDSVYVQIKSPCKKTFPFPFKVNMNTQPSLCNYESCDLFYMVMQWYDASTDQYIYDKYAHLLCCIQLVK